MTMVKHENAKHDVAFEPRFFDRLFDDLPSLVRRPFVLLSDRSLEPFNVEEFTEDGTFVIRVELPGVDPDKDLELSIEEGLLHLRAERHENKKTEGRDYVRREIFYGSFQRELPVPKGTKLEDVKATYVDGILEVRVPVLAAGREVAKKVPVTRA